MGEEGGRDGTDGRPWGFLNPTAFYGKKAARLEREEGVMDAGVMPIRKDVREKLSRWIFLQSR